MSTVRITTTQYEAMTDAWLESGSIAEVARRGSVSEDVARKLVNDGTQSLPPIRVRAERLRKIQLAESDSQRVEETRVLRTAARKVIGDTVKGLRSMRFVPSGKEVVDADGTKYIECDEKVYATTLNVMTRVVDLRNELDGITNKQSVGVGVQVNVGGDGEQKKALTTIEAMPEDTAMTPEQTRAMAENIKQQFGSEIFARHGKDAGRTGIVQALADATRLRLGNEADPA